MSSIKTHVDNFFNGCISLMETCNESLSKAMETYAENCSKEWAIEITVEDIRRNDGSIQEKFNYRIKHSALIGAIKKELRLLKQRKEIIKLQRKVLKLYSEDMEEKKKIELEKEKNEQEKEKEECIRKIESLINEAKISRNNLVQVVCHGLSQQLANQLISENDIYLDATWSNIEVHTHQDRLKTAALWGKYTLIEKLDEVIQEATDKISKEKKTSKLPCKIRFIRNPSLSEDLKKFRFQEDAKSQKFKNPVMK